MVGRLGAALLSVAALLALAHSASARQAQQPMTCPFGEPATITGTDGVDVLMGTPGKDVIVALGGNDRLDGLGGDDLLCGGTGDDQLLGGAGVDQLYGELGNDEIDGGSEMDGILGGPGDDRLVGGDGTDIVGYFDSPLGVQVDLASGVATGFGTDTVAGLEVIVGSEHSDVLTGDAFGNFFFPDVPRFPQFRKSDDVVRGGAGLDIVVFQLPVQANLAAGTAAGEGNDSLSNLEGVAVANNAPSVLIGNGGDNFLIGSDGGDTIRGSGGNDTIVGLVGNDRLTGGPGFDLVNGGPGSDNLDGGTGVGDTLSYSDSPTRVNVRLVDRVGVTGADRDRFTGFEVVAGSQLNDVMVGDAGPNTLQGNGGNDRVSGARGDDFLDGGGNSDRLSGGPGDDYCVDGERNAGCETKVRTTTSPSAMRRASTVLDLGRILARLDPRSSVAQSALQTPDQQSLVSPLSPAILVLRAATDLAGRVEYTKPPTCEGALASISPPTGVKPFNDLGPGQLTLHWQGMLMLGNRVVLETPPVKAVFAGLNHAMPGHTIEWRDRRTNKVYESSSRRLTGKGRHVLKAIVSIGEIPGRRSSKIVPTIPQFCPTR